MAGSKISFLLILQLLDISPEISITRLVPVQLRSVGISSADVLPEPLPPKTAICPSLLTGEKAIVPFIFPKSIPCAAFLVVNFNVGDVDNDTGVFMCFLEETINI